MQGALETERLLLNRPRLADVAALFSFLGDPVAMGFTHCDADIAACRRRIAVHEFMRRRDGCAPWVVRRKSDAMIIGWGGLYLDPFDPGWGIELGYAFHPSCWGQGLATELCRTALAVADRQLAVPALSAFAHPRNLASKRLLKRLGFEGLRYVESMERTLYRRRRPEP